MCAQFRGAISDFHAFKARIVDADCDVLLVRANDDDVYGDGNNLMVCMPCLIIVLHC